MTLYFGSLPLEWGDYKCALACLVCGCWGLTPGLHMCWASTLPSERHSQSAGTVLKDTSILYWVSRQLRLREAPLHFYKQRPLYLSEVLVVNHLAVLGVGATAEAGSHFYLMLLVSREFLQKMAWCLSGPQSARHKQVPIGSGVVLRCAARCTIRQFILILWLFMEYSWG